MTVRCTPTMTVFASPTRAAPPTPWQPTPTRCATNLRDLNRVWLVVKCVEHTSQPTTLYLNVDIALQACYFFIKIFTIKTWENKALAGSVTLKDIAQEAQVSVGTVSRVFNNHINVTEEVRQRVLKAATQLGYFGAAGQEARPYEGNRIVKEIGFFFTTFIP